MKAQNILESINDLIFNGQTESAFQKLKSMLQGSKRLKTLSLQSARYQDTIQAIDEGTITYEEASVDKNRIRKALLSMIETLEEELSQDASLGADIEQAYNKPSGSTLDTEGLKAKEDIRIKAKQKGSEAKFKDLDAGKGINIDIDQQ